MASSTSEMRVPITVSTLNSMMKLAARYMSCPRRALKSNGPVVGRLMTTDTIVAPEMSWGSIQTQGHHKWDPRMSPHRI